METIEDNGVTYVKATALAKKHRYTTDYIGQLCRSGKVDAKLIGRAWFVNEVTLQSHKSDRYSTPRSAEITINKSLVSDRAAHPVALRREVRPVLSKSVHRSLLQNSEPKTYNFESRGAGLVSTYHQDEELLEPHVSIKPKPEVAHNPAELETKTIEKAQKISVSLGEKASQKLAFEELPEVLLRGDLKVDSLDDPDLFTEVEPVRAEHIQFAPQSVLKTAVIATNPDQTGVTHPKVRVHHVESRQVPKNQVRNVVPPLKVATVIYQPVVARAETNDIPKPAVRFIVVPVLVTTALVVCVVMLGLVSYAETDGLQFRQSVKFSPATVIEAVSKIVESY
ncbi:hypothetical protein K2P47_04405 [Patescibacteria group bacterium]|nr:hypothetical protein [Patescibacteria group bacterium]